MVTRLKWVGTCTVLWPIDVIHHSLLCPSLPLHYLHFPVFTLCLSLSLKLSLPFVCFCLVWSGLTTAASALSQQVAVTGIACARARAVAAQVPPSQPPLSYSCAGQPVVLWVCPSQKLHQQDTWKIKASNATFLKTCYVRWIKTQRRNPSLRNNQWKRRK